MILEGLRTLFLAQPGITALLHQNAPALLGVYINEIPQGAKPDLILLTRMDQDANNTLDGTTDDLLLTEIEIDARAESYSRAARLARALDGFFRNYAGPAGDFTVRAVVKGGTQDDYDPEPEAGQNRGRHLVTVEYQVQWGA